MTHSIMFHHFHNENHFPAQGSLSSDEFGAMLDWLAQRYKILSAFEYLEQFERGTLDKSDVCLSLDDAQTEEEKYAETVHTGAFESTRIEKSGDDLRDRELSEIEIEDKKSGHILGNKA